MPIPGITMMGAAGAQSEAFSGSYLSSDSSAKAASHTFSSVSLGDAASSRLIVVGVVQKDDSGAGSISSVTVGGVSATKAVDSGASPEIRCSIWYAEVPSGTSGDIVVTLGNSDAVSIGVWRLVKPGASKAASNTGSDANNTADQTSIFATVPTNGFGVVVTGYEGNVSLAASGYTERFDTNNGRNGGDFTTSSTLVTTGSGDNGIATAYAAWGP